MLTRFRHFLKRLGSRIGSLTGNIWWSQAAGLSRPAYRNALTFKRVGSQSLLKRKNVWILGIVILVSLALCSPLAIHYLLTSVINNPMDIAGPNNQRCFFKPDVPDPKLKLTLVLNTPQEWEPVPELGVPYQPSLVPNLPASRTLQQSLERTWCLTVLKHNPRPQSNASHEQSQSIRWQNAKNRPVSLLWQMQPYTQVNMFFS